jgi:hypothetical protein
MAGLACESKVGPLGAAMLILQGEVLTGQRHQSQRVSDLERNGRPCVGVKSWAIRSCYAHTTRGSFDWFALSVTEHFPEMRGLVGLGCGSKVEPWKAGMLMLRGQLLAAGWRSAIHYKLLVEPGWSVLYRTQSLGPDETERNCQYDQSAWIKPL